MVERLVANEKVEGSSPFARSILCFQILKKKITIENQGFGKAEITFRHGGSGVLLLLHGNPMSHVTWHKIADGLKVNFTLLQQI